MIKKIIFILIVLTIQLSYSQVVNFPIDKDSGEIIYSKVTQTPGLSKNELFLYANEWFANSFKSSKDVIQFSDKESGKIIAKGNLDTSYRTLGMLIEIGYVSFTIEVATKNGRYRYIIKNFWHHKGISSVKSPGDLRIKKSGMQLSRKAWRSIKEQTNNKIIYLIKSLEVTMLTKKKDKW
jgi:hypothetical protein